MRICGIVAEYNPFHNGHALHIRETRRLLGADTAIVCCMSGSYVQRGEPALLPKWARAESAVLGGADLVLELPAAWSLCSAEGFAGAAVYLLESLGCVTDLSFGSECADTAALQQLAALLLEHDTVAATLQELRSGISYAAARERALYRQVQEQAALLRQSNIILGVEYCKALQQQGSAITPHAVLRQGAGHDAPEAAQGLCAASLLRRWLAAGQWEACLPFLPPEGAALLQRQREAGCCPALAEKGAAAVMARLWRLPPEELGLLPGAAEGLEHRLYSAIQQAATPEQVCDLGKTKRYAHARLRRMVWCAFLGITAQEAAARPPYLRVLAFSDRGRRVLAQARKTASLPLLTKPAHAKQLPPEARAAFQREALRTRLHSLFWPDPLACDPAGEWTRGPFYQKDEN